jgi:N-acetylneuraminate synthase/N,N'-diacetyllegionaminate synthase
MIIGNFDTANQPLLIAEIGNNHEGDAALAHDLADAALDAGAHVVKFQIINPVRLVNRSDYARIAQLSGYRLPLETFADIAEKVRARGGLFMASAFDTQSLMSVATLLDAVKIASGDLDFVPLLACAAATGKPVVLSTGMSSLDEVRGAVATLAAHFPAPGRLEESLGILHCVSLYPTRLEHANLSAINTLRDAFNVTIGYSDHTLGIEAAIVAVALGARVIEKHFTLDKNRTSFRDHALSADPREFKRLAEIMRVCDAMVGSGERSMEMADAATRSAARRSIVCARDLPAGTVVTVADLDFVRPANGLPPTALDRVVGRSLRSSCQSHHVLKESDFV